MASMLPKPQKPTPADPPLFSISTPSITFLGVQTGDILHRPTNIGSPTGVTTLADASQHGSDEISQMQKSDDAKSTKQSPATPN
jgi:hypothetical protein